MGLLYSKFHTTVSYDIYIVNTKQSKLDTNVQENRQELDANVVKPEKMG